MPAQTATFQQMSAQQTVLRAFVASPSDVAEERSVLEEVVREFNITWSQNFGIRIELLRWETHTFPSSGKSAQAVINEQIGDDYDLFIGIMWHRFGTPTDGFGSGTEEEFYRAWKRFKADSAPLHVMFYFKDAPLPPSRLDLPQLQRIREFRENLGDEGVYHWTFNDTAQFREFARIHLARFVQQRAGTLRALSSGGLPLPREELPDLQQIDMDEDVGLLDLLELGKEHGEEAAAALERMTAAITDYNAAMIRRTAQMEELNSSGKQDISAAKKLAALSAEDMSVFVRRVEAELPIFPLSHPADPISARHWA
jgi:hypothetical protein